MTEHITTSLMQRFRVRALPVGELNSIAEHLEVCPSCNHQFTDILRSQRGSEPLKITLAPEFQSRHEHVDYDQLVRLADGKMHATEREMLDVHLKVCAPCQEDVRSFLAFREQIDNETRPSFPAIAKEPTREKPPWFAWWRGLAWNPVYAAAVVLIGIALVIGVALFVKRRAANLEAKQTQPNVILGAPTQSPTPDQSVAVQPTPAPGPSEQLPRHAPTPSLTVKNREPIRKPENASAVVALIDGQRTVTVAGTGSISGLENIPSETQRNVTEALLAQNIEKPEIAKALSPSSVTLRGPSSGQPFKLLFPGRTVIVSDRPLFEWEKLPGATAYRVIVGDMRGHEVATSEDLSPDRISWSSPKPLTRGEIYAWNVIAIVNGKKIVSPGASASEMKFKVLSTSSAQELEQLQKAGSHLALGVFYAREGMSGEAEREFQILAKQNPNSPLPKKFLKQIQSWRSAG
jgi:hypothetical protein